MRQLIAAKAKVVRTNDTLAVGEQVFSKSIPLTQLFPLAQCPDVNLYCPSPYGFTGYTMMEVSILIPCGTDSIGTGAAYSWTA